MRTNSLVFLVLLVALFSCNEPQPEPTAGNELPSTSLTVYPAKDTVLKTPGGALISIPAGALDAGEAATVVLEVKEAYTPEEMRRGKLIDNSHGQALNSLGMIYLNVAPGQSVSIHKPLGVSMPAKYWQKGLMVYKGLFDENAIFRWADARSLEDNPAQGQLDAGKAIFLSSCAACHGLKGEAAGPPLAWITKRRDRQWLQAFTRNNATLLWRGDAYSCYLFNRYKTPMPSFPELSDADLASLYRYIDMASRSVDSNSVPNGRQVFDSCVRNDPNCGGVATRTSVVASQDPADTTAASQAAATDYYRFTVEKHGWYSVAGKGGADGATADRTDAGGASGSVASGGATDPAAGSPDSDPSRRAEALQACPCWCNEAAYRQADSLARVLRR